MEGQCALNLSTFHNFLFCCIIPIIVRPQNDQNDAFTAITKSLLQLMSRTISFKKWRAQTDYSKQEAALCSTLLSRHLVIVVHSALKQSPPRRCLFPKLPIHNVQGFSIVSSSVVVVRALLLSSNLYWWPKKSSMLCSSMKEKDYKWRLIIILLAQYL